MKTDINWRGASRRWRRWVTRQECMEDPGEDNQRMLLQRNDAESLHDPNVGGIKSNPIRGWKIWRRSRCVCVMCSGDTWWCCLSEWLSTTTGCGDGVEDEMEWLMLCSHHYHPHLSISKHNRLCCRDRVIQSIGAKQIAASRWLTDSKLWSLFFLRPLGLGKCLKQQENNNNTKSKWTTTRQHANDCRCRWRRWWWWWSICVSAFDRRCSCGCQCLSFLSFDLPSSTHHHVHRIQLNRSLSLSFSFICHSLSSQHFIHRSSSIRHGHTDNENEQRMRSSTHVPPALSPKYPPKLFGLVGWMVGGQRGE